MHPDTLREQKTTGLFLPVMLVFGWQMVIAFLARPLQTNPLDGLVLSVIYLLFACVTVWGIGWLRTVHRLAAAAGALAFSPFYVWQFREVVRLPDLKSSVPFVCVGAAITLYALTAIGSKKIPPRRLLFRAITTLLACVAIVGISFEKSPGLRWELTRRHTQFGLPTWLILGPSSVQIEKDLWADRSQAGHRSEPPSVDWHSDGQQPAIVFIMIDTLRRDSLGAFGGHSALMPRINELVQESVVFENVLANASWTRPSIGSMFTGLYQEYHGAIGRENALHEPTDTVAEVLAGQGYETAAFVTNWGAVGRDAGFDQGFHTFRECKTHNSPYVRADSLTAKVIHWVKQRAQDPERSQRPLFLYVHYLDPHIPYLSGGHDSNIFSKTRRAYEREVAFVDQHAGQLVHSLDQALDAPFFTIFASDHGEEFGDHGQKGHGFSLYQEVVRIPAFIRTPARKGGAVSARLEGRDLYDLMLQAAANPSFDPSDWAHTRDKPLRYTSQYLRTNVPMYRPEYRHVCNRAVDREGLFFIWSARGPTLEIYDRDKDPGETRNLIRFHQALVPGLQLDLDTRVPAPWIDRASAQLSGDTMEQLEALGYIH